MNPNKQAFLFKILNLQMKQYKFTAVILLFLLAFISGSGFCKQAVEPAVSHTKVNFFSSEKYKISPITFGQAKESDLHFIVKKKVKYRATTSESSTLKAPYFTKLVHFKIFKNRLIYGIATTYQIQRHTHLHLYQLF
uniref:hypothetical protein n=2 Tax=Flavobacteriaceae TaxID=49546 RepID=UPI001F5192D8|nr:hypothetical protein [Flavobacterium sp. Root935]